MIGPTAVRLVQTHIVLQDVMNQKRSCRGMSSYLDDGDDVVYTRHQRASWKDELIVGLFKDMTIIRRATTQTSIRSHLVPRDEPHILAK